MTARDVFWLLFIFVPLCIIWAVTLIDMMRRNDLVGWMKALWAMVIIFFPWIGVCAYLILRPREATASAYARDTAPTSAAAAAPVSPTPTYRPQTAPTAVPTQATPTTGNSMEAMS